MKARVRQLWVATRFSLLEQVQNRLAIGLLLVFVPIWYLLVGLVETGTPPAEFRFRVTDTFLHVSSRDLSLLTAGLNSLTLIVGFMLFAAARRSIAFDRRLALSGYSSGALIGARLIVAFLAAVIVAVYAALILLAYFSPDHLAVVWVGFFGAALAYGALGLLMGVVVPGELEGFFVIIMISLIDTFIQNPIGNPAANKHFVEFFPSFGPMQLAVAGGFTDRFPVGQLLVSLAWPLAFALLAVAAFAWRTRSST